MVGLRLNTAADPQPAAPVVHDDESPAPKARDLFAGTGIASSVLMSQGYQVTSLDSDPKFALTICCIILEWPYQKYTPHDHHGCPTLYTIFQGQNSW